MKILGIESSCDETAAAVVEDGRVILSNVVQSQIDLHKAYGGVVPEVAARSHIEVINAVIDTAVSEAGSWNQIDAIAVTRAPGLIGSLLIGTLAARTLAIVKNKPLIPVHHIEAHVYATFLNHPASTPLQPQPDFPLLALVVSGGHTQLLLFKNHGDLQVVGGTRDDAVGEVFDKVAKILGLPYPGGPSISKAAQNGDPRAYQLPKAKLDLPYDFSFSGLKTATLRAAQKVVGKTHDFPSGAIAPLLSAKQQADLAASFQSVAIATLVDKFIEACQEFQPASTALAGGVAANQLLRSELTRRLNQLDTPLAVAPPALCTDNAAMVASCGYFRVINHVNGRPTQSVFADPYTLTVDPNFELT